MTRKAQTCPKCGTEPERHHRPCCEFRGVWEDRNAHRGPTVFPSPLELCEKIAGKRALKALEKR